MTGALSLALELTPTTDEPAPVWPVEEAVHRLRVWGTETTFELPESLLSWTIGAGSECDLRLDDATGCVSRIHALLFRDGWQWILRDRDSKNGVWVDGLRCNEVVIEPGQEIRIGGVTLIAESARWVRVRQWLCRVLGWSPAALLEVDSALQRIRQSTTRRVPVVLYGAGDLVRLARQLHDEVLGAARPFVDCDPRHATELNTDAGATRCRSAAQGAAAAAGGTLCMHGDRIPVDARSISASLRSPASAVRLVVVVQAVAPALMSAPIYVPTLVERANELERLMQELAYVTQAALGAPPTALGADDQQRLREEPCGTVDELEVAVRRLVAVRTIRGHAKAAAWLGMSASGLSAWAVRRGLAVRRPRRLEADLDEAVRRPVSPQYVAEVLRRHPSERDQIFGLLLTSRGKTFIAEVLRIEAAVGEGAPRAAPEVSSSASASPVDAAPSTAGARRRRAPTTLPGRRAHE